jgi:hypothetical protein
MNEQRTNVKPFIRRLRGLTQIPGGPRYKLYYAVSCGSSLNFARWIDRSADDFPKHIEQSELIFRDATPVPESRSESAIHRLWMHRVMEAPTPPLSSFLKIRVNLRMPFSSSFLVFDSNGRI